MHSHKGSTTRAAVGHLMEEIGVLCASPATRPAALGFQQRGKHHEEHCICGCRWADDGGRHLENLDS